MIYKGTKGDDDLLGTDADDLFVPLIGHDAVQAGAGFDTLRIDYSRFASSKWDSTIIIEADGTMGGVISGAGRNWVEYQGIEALAPFMSRTRRISASGGSASTVAPASTRSNMAACRATARCA